MIDIPDVDIEIKNRNEIVKLFPEATIASLVINDEVKHHNTGVYFQNIPKNPFNNLAAFPYKYAEELGYYKVDFLSCPNPYDAINNMEELNELLEIETDWKWFEDMDFVKKLFHLGGTSNINDNIIPNAGIVSSYKPKSTVDLAILLAVIRPAKKYLIGENWKILREKIWIKEEGRQFKKSHSVAYALVAEIDAKIKAPDYFNF